MLTDRIQNTSTDTQNIAMLIKHITDVFNEHFCFYNAELRIFILNMIFDVVQVL